MKHESDMILSYVNILDCIVRFSILLSIKIRKDTAFYKFLSAALCARQPMTKPTAKPRTSVAVTYVIDWVTVRFIFLWFGSQTQAPLPMTTLVLLKG